MRLRRGLSRRNGKVFKVVSVSRTTLVASSAVIWRSGAEVVWVNGTVSGRPRTICGQSSRKTETGQGTPVKATKVGSSSQEGPLRASRSRSRDLGVGRKVTAGNGSFATGR